MTRQSYYPLVVMCLLLEYASSQYKTHQTKRPVSPSCSESNKNSLVEQFFDLIFSEFQNNPPVCVCVQMCKNQATYCYPNGCLRKSKLPSQVETHMPPAPAQASTFLYKVQKDNAQPKSFLVHDQSEFLSKLLDRNFTGEKLLGPRHSIDEPLLPFKQQNNLRSDIYEPSKSIFKYKKVPKVHLRYNLREQVKNTKTEGIKIEKIDMTKTRWPPQKRSNFFLEKLTDGRPDEYSENIKAFPSISLDSGQAVLPTKFFKRDISRGRNGKIREKEIFDETGDNNLTQMLEHLIENLIDNRFGTLPNDTELDFNVNVDYAISNVTTKLPENQDEKLPRLDENLSYNDTSAVNILSKDLKNQSIDQNKYTNDEMYINTYKEMIATLSKNIDNQYNNSVLQMSRIVGNTQTNEDASFNKTDSKMDVTMNDLITNNEFNQNLENNSSQSLSKLLLMAKREINQTVGDNSKQLFTTISSIEEREINETLGKNTSQSLSILASITKIETNFSVAESSNQSVTTLSSIKEDEIDESLVDNRSQSLSTPLLTTIAKIEMNQTISDSFQPSLSPINVSLFPIYEIEEREINQYIGKNSSQQLSTRSSIQERGIIQSIRDNASPSVSPMSWPEENEMNQTLEDNSTQSTLPSTTKREINQIVGENFNQSMTTLSPMIEKEITRTKSKQRINRKLKISKLN